MNISTSRTPLIIAIGWVATAAIAFCIGRLGSPSPTSTNAEGVVGASSDRRGGIQTESSAEGASARAAGMNGQFAMSENGGPLTVARVTNGQPLDKWMKKLMSQEDNIVRMTGLTRFLEAVRDTAELQTAAEAINLRGGRGGRFTEYSMILEKWAQLDPKGAMAFVETRSREEKMIGTSAVLRTWTRTDASAAIAWAQTNGKDSAPEENSREGPGGPGGPPGWGGQGNVALSAVVSQLARTDLERALSVAAAETFDRHSRTLDTLASELVSQRGIEGARSALESLAAGSLRDGLTTELADKFASKDAPSAAAWALSLPEGEAKSRALAETIGQWAKKDAVAAGAFLAKLPTTAETDRSRETYANTIAQKNPESALAWAAAIVDDGRKLHTVENVARSWVRQDAPAATTWLAQSGLPEEVKTRVQAPSKGGSSYSKGPGPGR